MRTLTNRRDFVKPSSATVAGGFSIGKILFLTCCFLIISGTTLFAQTGQYETQDGNHVFPEWERGYFDIHHIETGKGNSTFLVFPDGTTMLIDAGASNFNLKPYKISPALPSDSLTSGEWIVHYIKQVFPENQTPQIDFALITHFHGDHYGVVTRNTPLSESGKYRLIGITEVAERLPVRKLIDRNYPDYDYPVDLKNRQPADPTFMNYLSFIDRKTKHEGMVAESLVAGSNRQITMLKYPADYPDFQVRNIKSGGEVWSGKEDQTLKCIPDSARKYYGKLFGENQLSIALKFSYGPFDYYHGGDNTGTQTAEYPWLDVETPVARSTGAVDVATLDHHGNRDACNAFWVETLRPQVYVQQSWCSDQPGQEVFYRLSADRPGLPKADIFATYIHEETKIVYGPEFTKAYKSMEGHIVIRVMHGGKEFYVYVLDARSANLKVKRKFGPYMSNLIEIEN
jgi:beta-lactamase superfamily II metal-dependent hydrolase